MLRNLGSIKTEYNDDTIIKYYHCISGTHHIDYCCETCWNHHPNKDLHLGKFDTYRAFNNYNVLYKGKDKVKAILPSHISRSSTTSLSSTTKEVK